MSSEQGRPNMLKRKCSTSQSGTQKPQPKSLLIIKKAKGEKTSPRKNGNSNAEATVQTKSSNPVKKRKPKTMYYSHNFKCNYCPYRADTRAKTSRHEKKQHLKVSKTRTLNVDKGAILKTKTKKSFTQKTVVASKAEANIEGAEHHSPSPVDVASTSNNINKEQQSPQKDCRSDDKGSDSVTTATNGSVLNLAPDTNNLEGESSPGEDMQATLRPAGSKVASAPVRKRPPFNFNTLSAILNVKKTSLLGDSEVDEPFACGWCDYSSNVLSCVTRHIRMKHRGTDFHVLYDCSLCKFNSKLGKEIRAHAREAHHFVEKKKQRREVQK